MVERGGLDFRIEIEDFFSANTELFIAKITEAKEAFKRFKSEVAGTKAIFKDLTKEQDKFVKNTQAVSTAQKKAVKSSKEQKKALTVEEQARKNILRQLKKEAVTREENRLMQDRALRTQKRSLETSRLAARAAKSAALAAKKEEEAILRKTGAMSAEDASRRKSLITRNAEIAVARKVAAADTQEIVNKKLLAMGRDPSGRILTPTDPQANAAKRLNNELARMKENLALKELKKSSKEFQGLQRQMKATEGRANRISFTFRRLIGIMAAFTVVRLAAQGFAGLIKQAVTFSSKLEQAELGVAALITAVGELRNLAGEVLTPFDGLAKAQILAREQVQLLRKDALRTAATFDQLAETFQTALAPGLSAGLDLSAIRKFTVQISQAASAIALPQNQLAEEIRSLLAGTIQARTTRIATSLGITNEDIKRVKEAGTLAEFLQLKFEAFTVAGEKSLKTFAALSTNAKDALLGVIATGAREYFIEIKALLGDFIGSLTNVEGVGDSFFSPDAILVAEAFFDGLKEAVASAREVGKGLNLTSLIPIARTLGLGISAIAKTVSAFVIVLVKGLSNALSLVLRIVDVFDALKDGAVALLPEDSLKASSDLLLEILSTTVILGFAFKTMVGTVKLLWIGLSGVVLPAKVLLLTITKTKTVLAAIRVIYFTMAAPVVLIAGTFALIVGLAQKFLSYLTGTNLTIKSTILLIKVGLVEAFQQFISGIQNLWNDFAYGAKAAFDIIIFEILNGVLLIAEKVLDAVGLISGAASEAAQSVRDYRLESERSFRSARRIAKEEHDRAKQRIADQRILQREKNAIEAGNIVDNQDSTTSLAEDLKNIISDTTDGLFNAFKKGGEAFKEGLSLADQVAQAKSLAAAIEILPPALVASSNALKEQSSIMQKLREDSFDLSDAEAARLKTIGVQGSALEIQNRISRTLLSQKKQERRLDKEIESSKTRQLLAEKRILEVIRSNKSLSGADGNEAALTQTIFTTTARFVSELGKQKQLEAELQVLTRKRKLEGKSLTAEQLSLLDIQIAKTKTKVALTKKQVIQEKIATSQMETFISKLSNTDARGALIEIIKNLKIITAEESTIEKKLAAQQALRDALLAKASLQVGVSARIATAEMDRQNSLLEARLSTEKEVTRAIISRRDISVAEAGAQGRIAKLEAQLTIQKDINRATIQSLRTSQKDIKNEADKLAIGEQILSLERLQNAQRDITLEKISQAKFKLQEIQDQASNPSFVAGFTRAFDEIAANAPSAFQSGLDIMLDMMDEFASSISDLLLIALDPNADGDALKQRFASFMKSISKIILDELVKLAIAKALLGLGAGATSTSGYYNSSNPISKAEGGPAPKKGTPSLAHFSSAARGYAGGGQIANSPAPKVRRPKGIDSRDTTPIWTQPEEWVIRLASVRKYGHDIMDSINRGLIDPTSLRALAGSGRTAKARRRVTSSSNKTGYASGGRISAGTQNQQALTASVSAQSGQGLVQVVNAPDQLTLDRLIKSNPQSLIRFLKANKAEIGISQ